MTFPEIPKGNNQYKDLLDMIDKGLGYYDEDGEFCLLTHGLGGEFQQTNDQLLRTISKEGKNTSYPEDLS